MKRNIFAYTALAAMRATTAAASMKNEEIARNRKRPRKRKKARGGNACPLVASFCSPSLFANTARALKKGVSIKQAVT